MIRFFDFVFSFLGLIVLIPFFVILSVFIKIDSKGPAFYRQLRVGKNGKEFKLFKFRSMYVNSDKGGLITVGNNDSRITRLGQFIRKYKLDELPQLINVLIGDMSIVGPRPEVQKYVDLYTNEQRIVLNVRPGITDYASLAYSDENELLKNIIDPENYYINTLIPAKIKLNMVYVENQNLIHYFKIIFLTIFKLIK